jgi:hypothetical protein
VITALLLEDWYRQGQAIRLPGDALLTPAARDWIKEHPVPVEWADESDSPAGKLVAVLDPAVTELRLMRSMLDRDGGLVEVIEPGPGYAGVIGATRQLCDRLLQNKAAHGVLFVQDAALPLCIANKHAGVRAAMAVSVPFVEEAARSLGINVLILEYPGLTTYQMKQMVNRLRSAPSSPPADTAEAISTLEKGADHARG